MPGKSGRTSQSYSECIDRALMHDALSKWGSRNLDSRCIPNVEGMLAFVKLGRRSIDCGISGRRSWDVVGTLGSKRDKLKEDSGTVVV